jgi:ubiquinone biosynthesis monooxygenase Coq7
MLNAQNPIDRVIGHLDDALRTLMPGTQQAQRAEPGADWPEADLTPAQRQQVIGLLRVNHCGEVCAQGLYAGQAATAKLADTRVQMQQAAQEEQDHVVWCEARLAQLDGKTSRLNPIFYGLSFSLGALAGIAGDRWSLGFVAATEDQVSDHLHEHLERLPAEELRSRAVVEQMLEDEQAHADHARAGGAAELPLPVKGLMKLVSKVMTTTTYRI